MFLRNTIRGHLFKRSITMEQLSKNPLNDYKAAISKLNALQSNANYIATVNQTNNNVDKLANVRKFLKRSGLSLDRLDTLSVIHVTGTKGKGSTCAFCESILRQHGFKTGFFSSPHLFEVRERIRINGRPISEDLFAEFFWKIYDRLDKAKENAVDMPLYFRFLTLMAFHVFLAEKVDVAIVEVGIGGEYDCTNVLRKVPVVGITSLGMDHEALLGDTLESIAWNKAGIMKEKCQAFTVSQPDSALDVLKKRSVEKNATLTVLKSIPVHLNGNFTFPKSILESNANLAIHLCNAWTETTNKRFSMELAEIGLNACRWPGRFHIIPVKKARFCLDGAHTLESIEICVDWFEQLTKESNRKRVLVFNLTGNRNSEAILSKLQQIHFDLALFVTNFVYRNANDSESSNYYLTTDVQFRRCREHEALWKAMRRDGATMVFNSIENVVEFIEGNGEECDVLVTGSLHLVGGVLSLLEPSLND